ncbi:MAG: hypothetical protein QXH27_04075 [Candidatus Micrarchaeia archaeon]
MAFERLRRGEATLEELIAVEELKFELNSGLLELARLRAEGKEDAQLAARVGAQKGLLSELAALKHKLGIADYTPGEEELRRLTKEFKQARDAGVLARIREIISANHARKREIAEKALAQVKKEAKAPAPSLPPVPSLVVRAIHGRRAEYVREEDVTEFDANEGEIRSAGEELQRERLRGNLQKCAELERTLSVLIEKREALIARAEEILAKEVSEEMGKARALRAR